MINYFNNSQSDKFVLSSTSEISLYQLDGANRAQGLILEEPKAQSLSKS